MQAAARMRVPVCPWKLSELVQILQRLVRLGSVLSGGFYAQTCKVAIAILPIPLILGFRAIRIIGTVAKVWLGCSLLALEALSISLGSSSLEEK